MSLDLLSEDNKVETIDENAPVPVRCRKCRFVLFVHPEVPVQDTHGTVSESNKPDIESSCTSEVWYIPEEKCPMWLKDNLEAGGWVKGKIKCPNAKCDGRIGSYNFVNGMKCPCGVRVLPPIHLVKSKIDFQVKPIILNPQ